MATRTEKKKSVTKFNVKKKQFLEIYSKNGCNISRACEKMGVDRGWYYDRRKEDPEFDKDCLAAEEAILDFAESQLLKNIKEGKETSLIFLLKCKGKRRGYVERQEIEHSGSLGVNIIDDVR